MLRKCWVVVSVLAVICGAPAAAEEGGSGHYMPGGVGSFIDAFPLGRPGPAYMNSFGYYNGSVGGGRTLPFGGLLATGVEATAYVQTSIFLYQTPWKLLGGDYGVGLVVPFIWMEVEADVRLGDRAVSLRDTADGFGDLMLLPIMLGWQRGDLKYAVSLGIYTPTGDYDKGHLANVGKNYWTFEPVGSFSYLSSDIGLEVSGFAGFDFNTGNDKTDYETGDQFHLDLTVAQHLPLFGGIIGLGAATFYYQQIDGDSGSGAVLGDFKGRTVGIGPVGSYVTKIGDASIVAEAKWLPELEVENRLKGDIVWAKFVLLF